MNDLIDDLQAMDWGDSRTVNTTRGPRTVQDLGEDSLGDFWQLWRKSKEDMKELGIAVSKDDMTGEYDISWWTTPGSIPAVPKRPKLTPGVKVLNHLEDDGWGVLDVLDPDLFALMKPGQRKLVMTHFSVFQAGHPFSLDASRMGEGKTYIALCLMRLIGYNFGVVCPASVITKWESTCIDVFNLEPEFIQSWEKIRLGSCPDFCERIPMGRGGDKFRWNAISPVCLIFDEVHTATGEKSLSGAVLDAAIDNPHIFSLGLSGTAADDPTAMKVLGRALGLHDGSDFWKWAKQNGCREGFYGGLEFTKNRTMAYEYLGGIHRHIFPHRGGRLLESDAKDGSKRPPHEVFVTPVDVPPKLPESLGQFLEEVQMARDSDDDNAKTRAGRRKARISADVSPDPSAAVSAIRDRQEAELKLVPYVADRTLQAVAEGKSVALFCVHDGTLHALASMLPPDQVLYFNGAVSAADKTESLRQFQANVRPIIILNLAAGAASIDLHDLSGIHPRHSIIFPSFRAKLYAQASGRTDREGKLSKSVVELVFLTEDVHTDIMKAVQRKLDNLSMLNDGELSTLRIQ